jgi:hypothetical protein
MARVHILATAAACAALFGCSTGQTLQTMALPPAGATIRGLPYYLPRAYVSLTVTGGPPASKDPSSTGATGGDKGVAGAPVGAAPAPAVPAAAPAPVVPPPTPSASTGNTVYLFGATLSTPIIIPDRTAPLFLAYQHSIAADDQFDIAVDQRGLLQSSSGTATDQSGAAVVQAVQLIGQIAAAVAGFPSFKVDALEFVQGPKLAPVAPIAPAKCTLPPFSQAISFIPGETPPQPYSIGQGSQTLTVTIQNETQPPAPLFNLEPAGTLDRSQRPLMGMGVAFRRPIMRKFTAYVKTSDDAAKLCGIRSFHQDYYVTVPDTSFDGVFYEDTSRASLVTKSTKLAITNGMLTGVTISNPSELLASINLPGDILKALLSIPASILTFKVQQIAAQQGLTDAEAKAIESQITLLQQQAALKAAQSSATASP